MAARRGIIANFIFERVCADDSHLANVTHDIGDYIPYKLAADSFAQRLIDTQSPTRKICRAISTEIEL